MTDPHDERFQHQHYTIRSKFFRLLGDAFHIYDEQGNLTLYSNMKRFRLREDIRLYADESMEDELLRINTPGSGRRRAAVRHRGTPGVTRTP